MKDLAALGPRTIAAYTATGRSGAKALIEMGAALQVIRRGTGSSEQAATAFEAVMRNLTSPDKQQKLRSLGVSVRDSLTGEFRPITELMTEIVEKSGGSLETLGTIFDAEAVRAFNLLCRLEGIIPALESSHALAAALKAAKDMRPDQQIVVCLSGRGDKDIDHVNAWTAAHGGAPTA